MKSNFYKALLLGGVLALTACGNKEPEPAPAPPAEEPEVPMSAAPAEPTGVMHAEPVTVEESQAQAAPIEPAPETEHVQEEEQPPAQK